MDRIGGGTEEAIEIQNEPQATLPPVSLISKRRRASVAGEKSDNNSNDVIESHNLTENNDFSGDDKSNLTSKIIEGTCNIDLKKTAKHGGKNKENTSAEFVCDSAHVSVKKLIEKFDKVNVQTSGTRASFRQRNFVHQFERNSPIGQNGRGRCKSVDVRPTCLQIPSLKTIFEKDTPEYKAISSPEFVGHLHYEGSSDESDGGTSGEIKQSNFAVNAVKKWVNRCEYP